MIAPLATWLTPWEFSWSLLLIWLAAALLYWRGAKRRHPSLARRLAFWSGMALIYLSLHTYADYYAEHEFLAHRIQQVLLHHLAPLLIMASYPATVLRSGLSLRGRCRLRQGLRRCWPLHFTVRVLGNPTVATLLFVLFILIWLIPSFQTDAMLDWRVYRFMNWSMLISGLVYWGLVVDHRPHPPGRMVAGLRVLSPGLTMTPQVVAGAIVTFSRHDLYPIFEVCGRAFHFDVLTGQMLGGVVMWVPAALIEVAGAMAAMRQWMRLSQYGRIHPHTHRVRPSS